MIGRRSSVPPREAHCCQESPTVRINIDRFNRCRRYRRSYDNLRGLSRRRRADLDLDVEWGIVPGPLAHVLCIHVTAAALAQVVELGLYLVHRLHHVAEHRIERLDGSIIDAIATVALAPGAPDAVDEALRPGPKSR